MMVVHATRLQFRARKFAIAHEMCTSAFCPVTFTPEEAASGLRLSLGPWLTQEDLAGFPAALERARRRLEAGG